MQPKFESKIRVIRDYSTHHSISYHQPVWKPTLMGSGPHRSILQLLEQARRTLSILRPGPRWDIAFSIDDFQSRRFPHQHQAWVTLMKGDTIFR